MDLMLTYLAKSAAATAVFYIFMKALMERESLHGYLRLMWLAAMAFSLVLPLVTVDLGEVPQEVVHRIRRTVLPEAVMTPDAQKADGIWNAAGLLLAIWIAGAGVTVMFYIVSFLHIGRTVRGCCAADGKAAAVFADILRGHGAGVKARLVVSREDISPFSIFGTVVVSRKDSVSVQLREILLHELAHVSRRHSYDLLAAQLFTVLQWFNPCAWLMKASLAQVHEYSADRFVLDSGADIYEYQLLLIKKAVGPRYHSIANSLNHSNLKNRITMMGKSNPSSSSPGAVLKSMLALPVSALLIALFNVGDSAAGDKVMKIVPSVQEPQPSTRTCTFAEAEVKPSFMGKGPEAFSGWMLSQMQYPEDAAKEGKSGRVYVKFTITSEGKVTNAQILESPHKSFSEEVLRIISLSPDWTPGKISGENVSVEFAMPVVFALK